MMKIYLFICCVSIVIGIRANDDKVVLSINDNDIYYSKISINKEFIDKFFEVKHGHAPQNTEADIKLLKQLQMNIEINNLYELTMAAIKRQIQKDLIPSQEITNKYKKNQLESNEEMIFSTLLEAYNAVNQSDKANRYEIVYEKYLKDKKICSYKFFESNNTPHYINYLKINLESYQKTGFFLLEKKNDARRSLE